MNSAEILLVVCVVIVVAWALYIIYKQYKKDQEEKEKNGINVEQSTYNYMHTYMDNLHKNYPDMTPEEIKIQIETKYPWLKNWKKLEDLVHEDLTNPAVPYGE